MVYIFVRSKIKNNKGNNHITVTLSTLFLKNLLATSYCLSVTLLLLHEEYLAPPEHSVCLYEHILLLHLHFRASKGEPPNSEAQNLKNM